VDLGFFRDRATRGITWYNKKSTDVILPEPLPVSTGYFAQGSNAASIQNRGWEVSLKHPSCAAGGLAWEVGLTVGPQPQQGGCRLARARQFIVIGDFNNRWRWWAADRRVLGSGFLRCGISNGTTNIVDVAGGGNR